MATNRLVLAGASTVGRGTPWGTLCEVVAKALTPLGYDCTIESKSWGMQNGRYVADGRADLGAWLMTHVIDAYRGVRVFAPEGPRDNLRVIAHINHPAWIATAVRPESGIIDLADIVRDRIPVRIRTGGSQVITMIWEHYGITKELLESWGGSMKAAHEADFDAASAPIAEPELVDWVVDGDFDVILDSIYTGAAPEIPHWAQVTDRYDLEFLPMPEVLIERICGLGLASQGFVPHRLMRGIWTDVPSIQRLPHAIYCRSETPDNLATDVTQALDENRQLFRQCHLAYSYDSANVAADLGVPLHPAAANYYRSVGIPTS
jgi:TRAP-type uncharacterized transport system substrate-binding protein